MTILRLIALFAAALSLGACATAIRGTHTDFVVQTEPAGAKVITDLETKASRKAHRSNESLEPVYYSCDATPCDLRLSRRSNFTVFLDKEGYHPGWVKVESNVSLMGSGQAAATAAGGVVAGSAVYAATASPGIILATGGSVMGPALAMVGVAGLGVDVASGAVLSLQPNPVAVQLIPNDVVLPEGLAGGPPDAVPASS